MQWALVGGLGEAGAAALLALLCMAVVYLIRAIASALGTFSIGPVSIPIGKWFSDITTPVVSWLVGATNELWSDAQWWMRGVSYIFDGVFNDIKDALETDASFIAHLFNTVIPDAASHVAGGAVAYANSEIAALRREITSTASTLETDLTHEAARELAKATALVTTTEAALKKIAAKGITTAEDYADAEIAKARTYLEGLIAAIPIPSLGPITAEVGALAGTVAGVATGVAAITAEFGECAVTTCDGPNNLQGLLQNVLGLVDVATIGAFLAAVINDPAGAEAQYSGLIQSTFSTAQSTVDSLLAL